MTPDNVNPGGHAEHLPADGRTIAGVPTAVTALIGVARRGPVNQPEPVGGFAAFERTFGGLAADGELGYAVRQFFLNGGTSAWVVRVPRGADTRQWLQGLNALAAVDRFNLLVLPGLADPAVLAAAADTCRQRLAFLIAEAPPDARVPELMMQRMQNGALPRSSFGAVYFPWLRIADPLNPAAPRAAPPGGTIAGLYARTDTLRGVWQAPAGTDAIVHGVHELDCALSDAQIGALTSLGVDCLRTFPDQVVAWGARTLDGADSSNSDWKFVPVRRMALYLEESVLQGTRWAVSEPNGPTLWAQLQSSIAGFLQSRFLQGAFAGGSPATSYYVRCDATTTTAADIVAGEVNIEIGFAPLRAAEFVVITVRQMTAPPAGAGAAAGEAPAAGGATGDGGVARAVHRSRGLRLGRPVSR